MAKPKLSPSKKDRDRDVAPDPLLEAINHYLFAYDAFGELPEDLDEELVNAAGKKLLSEPQDVLGNWQEPAASMEGALAALRLLLRELEQPVDGEEVYGDRFHISLLKAALAYLEREGAQ